MLTATLVPTGSFVATSDPPVFPDDNLHPMFKVIHGPVGERQNQLMISSKVEALLFVANRRLVPMYLPKIGYDIVSDPDENTPVVAGPIGSLCDTALPATISLEEIMADCIVLAPAMPTSQFVHGDNLPRTLFIDEQHPDRPFPCLTDGEHALFRIPLCVPKLTGAPLLEGSITDPTVLAALQTYHDLTSKWLDFHALIAKDRAIVLSSATFKDIEDMPEDNLIPANPHDVPILTYSNVGINILIDGANDPSSLRYSVDLAIETRKNNNISLYRRTHPDMDPPAARTSSPQIGPSPPSLLTPLTLPPSSKQTDTFTIQGVTIPNKYMRAIHTFQAMLVTTRDGAPILPTLRKEFLQCFSQSSQQEATRYASLAMTEHDIDRSSTSRDYLLRLVTELPWNQATMTLFLNALFHTAPFDDAKESLKGNISFYTFLPAPTQSASQELKDYLRASHVEQMQVVVGESNENKQKLNLKTFQGGMRSTIQHVLTGIANLESRLSFIVDYSDLPADEKPLLVQWLLQLAHLFSSTEFTSFWAKYKESHLWIPYTMATQVQVLFALICKTASNIKMLQNLKTNQPILLETYQLPIKAFSTIVTDIQAVCAGTGAGYYTNPPLSWTIPSQPHHNHQPTHKRRSELPSDSTQPRRHSPPSRSFLGTPPSKGWIEADGIFHWPKDLSGKQLCNRFSQVGLSCPHGFNCTFAHKSFPTDFSREDKDIISKWVRRTSNVRFSPGVRHTQSFDVPLERPPSKSSSPFTPRAPSSAPSPVSPKPKSALKSPSKHAASS